MLQDKILMVRLRVILSETAYIKFLFLPCDTSLVYCIVCCNIKNVKKTKKINRLKRTIFWLFGQKQPSAAYTERLLLPCSQQIKFWIIEVKSSFLFYWWCVFKQQPKGDWRRGGTAFLSGPKEMQNAMGWRNGHEMQNTFFGNNKRGGETIKVAV